MIELGDKIAISGKSVTTSFDGKIIHDSVNFTIESGQIYGLLGGSGSGKTTLMKTMIYLKKPQSGQIYFFGEDMWSASSTRREAIALQSGVMFQFGALFSSMNVLENISVLLKEYSTMNESDINDLAMFWLQKVGLEPKTATLYPNELSGGMKKRAALARALALTPRVLFLDEPNSGLDPISARGIDRLVKKLKDMLGITIVMVTHDVDSIFDILDKFAIINSGKIIFEGDMSGVKKIENNPLAELFKARR